MKIKLIVNPKKAWAKALARDAALLLKAAGHLVVRKGAGATVCIGGDGTILYAHHKGRLEGPVLGIGSTRSYICQLRKQSWKKKLARLLARKKTVRIMTLEARVGGKRCVALNDFVVHATHFRVAELAVSAGGRRSSFEGDGVIVSTALGSAAYAYSAGGIKMAPLQRKISVVPICAYKRAFSPSVLPPGGTVTIRPGSDCAFIADGIYVRRLKRGEAVRIRKGRDAVLFEGVGHNDWQGRDTKARLC
jgi:NAD+ kinase